MKKLSGNYAADVEYISKTLRVDENFDIIRRRIIVGKNELSLFYIDGFVKDSILLRLMQYFIGLEGTGEGQGAAQIFADRHIPYVEVEVERDLDKMIMFALSGAVLMLGDGFGDEAIVVDAREYPARSTEEPEGDRVMQGARDGFVETLIFNTALIRRRIRDPALTMSYKNVGGSSKTDVVICYIEGRADPKFVREISKRIDELEPESLTLGEQSLSECLIRRRWYNPFPKIRTLERPDAVAAQLVEGSVIVLCDTSPLAMVLPTSIFDFMQETDDYYLPPLTGSYLRLLRYAVFALCLLLTPTWYLAIKHPDLVPEWLSFILPNEQYSVPIIAQLFLVEIAIDGLKLASMNTPNMLSNSLSVVGGLILGDFAVSVGWLSEHVILYMAIVAIAGFSQQNYELGYAFKFMRMILLALTAALGIWGWGGGILLIILLVATNKTVNGKYSYLYPLIPFNGKALARQIFRLKKSDYNRR